MSRANEVRACLRKVENAFLLAGGCAAAAGMLAFSGHTTFAMLLGGFAATYVAAAIYAVR